MIEYTIPFIVGLSGVFIGSIITYYINKRILEKQEKMKAFAKINRKQSNFILKIDEYVSARDEDELTGGELREFMDDVYNTLGELEFEIHCYLYLFDEKTISVLTENVNDIWSIIQLKPDFDSKEIADKLKKMIKHMRK